MGGTASSRRYDEGALSRLLFSGGPGVNSQTVDECISVLADRSAGVALRAQAARRLGSAAPADETRALAALMEIATDFESVGETLGRAAGAGIARLRVPKGIIDNSLFADCTLATIFGYDEEAARLALGATES
jgi:hypothetical protein